MRLLSAVQILYASESNQHNYPGNLTMELHEAIDSVSDTASFLAFVRLLVTDRVHFKVQKEAASPSSPYSSSANVIAEQYD